MKQGLPVCFDLVDHTCPRCGIRFRAMPLVKICPYCRGEVRAAALRRRDTPGAPLTPRQAQIARLIMEGLSNKEIAARLFLSTGTVKTYIVHIFCRTGANNRTDLAVSLLRAELLQERPAA